MNVEVQYTTDCPNARPVLQRLKELAATRSDLTLTITHVATMPTPAGFAGSPTVFIDGANLFGGTPASAPACALRPPTVEQVEAALALS